jgi:hypothetical protein
MSITLREGCDGVCPGVDLCEDRVIRVEHDADLVAGEIHVVNLAVGVVAPECRGERVLVRIVDSCSGVCGRKRGACHDDGNSCIETGDGVVLLHAGADVLCIGIFPHQVGPEGALGDCNRVYCHTTDSVCGAGERVVCDDCVDERLERVRVRDRVRESPGCGLGY